jgi:hypothetical protein
MKITKILVKHMQNKTPEAYRTSTKRWSENHLGGEEGIVDVLRKEEVRFPYQERELPLQQLPPSLRYHPPSVLSQKANQLTTGL